MASNKELMSILDASDRSISRTGGIPHEEFWGRARKQTKNQKTGRLSAADEREVD